MGVGQLKEPDLSAVERRELEIVVAFAVVRPVIEATVLI